MENKTTSRNKRGIDAIKIYQDKQNVTISSERNVIQKEADKKLRYKNVNIDFQRMWNMKCFDIPVISGATGIVTIGLNKI
jgi:hypothetical protein